MGIIPGHATSQKSAPAARSTPIHFASPGTLPDVVAALPRITPAIPTLVREPVHRPGWVHEEKIDG
jgi:hypothetical protein